MLTFSLHSGKCDNAIVNDQQKIADFRFTASGYVGYGHEPHNARFSGAQTWCEDLKRTGTYLQIDLVVSLRIIAVATMGDIGHFKGWVTSYKLLYSINATNWTSATVNGKEVNDIKLKWTLNYYGR